MFGALKVKTRTTPNRHWAWNRRLRGTIEAPGTGVDSLRAIGPEVDRTTAPAFTLFRPMYRTFTSLSLTACQDGVSKSFYHDAATAHIRPVLARCLLQFCERQAVEIQQFDRGLRRQMTIVFAGSSSARISDLSRSNASSRSDDGASMASTKRLPPSITTLTPAACAAASVSWALTAVSARYWTGSAYHLPAQPYRTHSVSYLQDGSQGHKSLFY